MPTIIPPHIIQSLITIGKRADIDAPALANEVAPLRQHEPLCRLHWESWHPVCEALPVEDHIALLKGLVMAECYAGWDSGSVSPGIWVYSKLKKRISGKESVDIAQWVIERSHNCYMPFGSSHRRADFISRQAHFAGEDFEGSVSFDLSFNAFVDHNHRVNAELERQKAAKEAKAERLALRQVDVDKHHSKKSDNDLQRRDLITAGETLDPIGRLRLIVDNPQMHMMSFPEEWSQISEQVLKCIDPELAQSLCSRLLNTKSKPWKILEQLLTAIKE